MNNYIITGLPDHIPTYESEKGEKSEALKTNYFSCQEEVSSGIKGKPNRIKPQSLWDIPELETYFQAIRLPTEPVKIDSGSIIKDIATFVEAHLSVIKNKNGNTAYLPYLHHLQKLKQHLINSHS